MKTRLFLLFVLSLLGNFNIYGQEFTVDGIVYNVLSEDDYTCEVANGKNVSGDIVLPTIVTNPQTGIRYSVAQIGKSAFCQAGLNSIVIPKSVIRIRNSAFAYCGNLRSLFIPSSVIDIAYSAFSGCNMESIVVDENNPKYDSRLGCDALINSETNELMQGCLNTFIPNSVTSIGQYAFYGCSSLTSVTIPSSVTSIGNNAFYNCSSLTSVTIPSSVTSIGNNAFYNCSSLTSVNIPEGVTSIGYGVFMSCSSLTSVNIPSSVTSIGTWAFSDCSGLTSVNIPSSVTSIGNKAFLNCSSLTSVTIPSSVTSIGERAFEGCSSLTSVTIPSSVTSIGDQAFRDCSSLTSVNIPSSVTSIEGSAFQGCSGLTSVTIPNSVTRIGNGAFYKCSRLTDVWCYAENAPTTDSDAFGNSPIGSAKLHVPPTSLESYSNTAPWNEFGAIVAIGPQVTRLLSNKWSSGAEYSVQAITYDSGVDDTNYHNNVVGVPEADVNGKNWYDVDYTCNWEERTSPLNNWCDHYGDIYARRTFYYDGEIPAELFLACGHDDAPCEYYLNGELIWSVTDGYNECEIYKLTSAQKALLRPGQLNVLAFHVHQNAGPMYADCGLYTSLSERNKCGDNLTWSFDGDTGTLTISGTGDMYGYDWDDVKKAPWYEIRNLIKNIVIQSGVTGIGNFAFYDLQALTSVTIPEGVITIHDNAFRNCTSLESVSLPESLKHLGGHSFLGCSALPSITIPDGITDLNRVAFQECSNLTTFTYNKAENELTKVDGVYQIGTAEDLCNFAILSTAANADICAQLTADIDYTGYTITGNSLDNHFQHIGLNGYRGTFDGNGHTITVNINNPDDWQIAALFRTLGKGGVIKNLRVAGHVESVSKYSAGIVSELKSGKVSHCVSDVDIVSNIDGDCTDGGIAGIATYDGQESIVEYCVVAGSFQGSNAHHRGGIIGIGRGGNSENITIDNCLFVANVDDLNVTESNTFVRDPISSTHITNCYYLNAMGDASAGTQVTSTQLTSGELCYLLNGDQSSINWTQNLTGNAADSYPLPFSTHAQVYVNGNIYANEKNYLSMPDTEGIVGGRTTIKVDLRNEDVIGGVQFKVKLPTGMSINTNNNGLKVLGTSRTSGLTVGASYNGQGDYYQVLIYGVGTSITGNSGTIVTLDVSISDALALGNYVVDIYDIAITDVQERLTYPSDVKGTLQLISPKSGDANRDGIINVADIISIANHILGSTPASFDANAANVNGDAVVNVADIITLANMILSGNGASVKELIFENGPDPE